MEMTVIDKADLTKEKLIWIAIRILGVSFAITAIRSLFRVISSISAVIFVGNCFENMSGLVTQSILIGGIVTDSAIIFVAVYLLFFAKRAHRLIERTLPLQDEDICESTLLATIAVRSFGVWFLFKGFIILVNRLLSMIHLQLFKRLISKGIEDGTITSNEFTELVNNQMPELAATLIASMIGYAIGAFYFLKYGKFVIGLISSRHQVSDKCTDESEVVGQN